jgi:hypothetical protein
MAALGDRATSLLIAENLTRPLRLHLGLFRLHLIALFHPRLGFLAFYRRPFLALASAIVVERRAGVANDFDATLAVGAETVIACQRTDPRRFRPDGVEHFQARQLHIELHAGMLVEQIQRTARRVGPLIVDRAGETTDPAQFQLHRPRGLGGRELRGFHHRRLGRQRRELLGRLAFRRRDSSRRHDRLIRLGLRGDRFIYGGLIGGSLVCCRLVGGSLVRDRLFHRRPRPFRCGRFGLLDRLGFFGVDPSRLRGFGVSGGFGLLGLPRALGG